MRASTKTALLVSDLSASRTEGGWLEARGREGKRRARDCLWALPLTRVFPLSCSHSLQMSQPSPCTQVYC